MTPVRERGISSEKMAPVREKMTDPVRDKMTALVEP
jgi:hypothetical protein